MNETSEEIKELTPEQRDELKEQETTIRNSQKQFRVLGRALHIINDKRLYKEEFTTFKEYCDKRWEFSEAHAFRFIKAYEVMKALESGDSPIGEDSLPQNEYQVRLLEKAGDDAEEWVAAWRKVIAAAEKKKTAITGALVEETLGSDEDDNSTAKSNAKATAKKAKAKALKLVQKAKSDVAKLTHEQMQKLLEEIEEELNKIPA